MGSYKWSYIPTTPLTTTHEPPSRVSGPCFWSSNLEEELGASQGFMISNRIFVGEGPNTAEEQAPD